MQQQNPMKGENYIIMQFLLAGNQHREANLQCLLLFSHRVCEKYSSNYCAVISLQFL